MLTCIACTKHLNGGSLAPPQDEEEDVVATPSKKQPIKTLTTQIKGMALKASGAYKNCKPCAGSRRENNRKSYEESIGGSVSSGRFHCGYQRGESTVKNWGKELGGRVKGMGMGMGLSSGEATPVSVSGRSESVVFMEEDEPKEWVAQVEPGVLITFVSMPQGGNDLKRIRFSRELFNKWQAQRWWAENYDKVMELYNVQKFNQQAVPSATPSRSEDESSKIESAQGSPATPPLSKERLPRNFHRPTGLAYSSTDSLDQHGARQYYESYGLASTPKLSNISASKTETSSVDASARSSLSREVDHSGELSVSNASDVETEWVEQDEPGVYITIRALPNGSRELRRVRFSRERFGEMHARVWWEENKARIQEQYL
ncbi:protein Brevis radix-like 2 [Chenopodium quinoa]|uniref:protein Brevis radix-like 2 n=1 Tax=Chenopodium quinoa TaxID=63459 RepID=UPI000B795DAB|nr:protein Brevis radix-like 2 [Chenopodium quinoa]